MFLGILGFSGALRIHYLFVCLSFPGGLAKNGPRPCFRLWDEKPASQAAWDWGLGPGPRATWTPKVCKIMAFMAVIMDVGLLFYILLWFR